MKKLLICALALVASVSVQAQDVPESGKDTLTRVYQEPFDRGIGLPNNRFIPKGTVGAGLTVSYSNYDLGNGTDDVGYKMLFSLLDGVSGSIQSIGLAPFLSYFISDNLSLGLRFGYDTTTLDLESAGMSIGDLVSFNLQDIGYEKQSYSGAIALRNYIPIAGSKRFAMFAELRASGGYAQSQSFQVTEEGKFGTYQDIYKASLSVVPGLCCFVTNEAALEVSVGVLGFTHQKTVQTTNQLEVSQMTQNNASFKINLFSINMGISIFIGPGNSRNKK